MCLGMYSGQTDHLKETVTQVTRDCSSFDLFTVILLPFNQVLSVTSKPHFTTH